ncbi:MAG: hypothetical protein J6V53_05740 [Alphaproteobacteria bacterium]|nr:hypothetical protein [Alphaproteobacteria bacterium]
MPNNKYMNASTPIIEIIATCRAKKKAAEKMNIPYKLGSEIDSLDITGQKEYHVHVDLSDIHGFEKHQYYKLMKKYIQKETKNILDPKRNLYSVIALSCVMLSMGLVVHCSSTKQKEQQSTIQSAFKNKTLKENQKTRE